MRRLKGLVCLAVLTWPWGAGAESLQVNQAKAAYVFNFIKFVDWPFSADRQDAGLTLCVLGNDELGKVLAELEGRIVARRKLHVQDAMRYGDPLDGCQVVVAGEGVRQKAAAIIRETDPAQVLTISEIEGFAEKGGCIGMVMREGKMMFEVNLDVLRRKKLLLPSQVLNLALNVFGKPGS